MPHFLQKMARYDKQTKPMSYRTHFVGRIVGVCIGFAIAYYYNSKQLGYWGWQAPVCAVVLLILVLIRGFYPRG